MHFLFYYNFVFLFTLLFNYSTFHCIIVLLRMKATLFQIVSKNFIIHVVLLTLQCSISISFLLNDATFWMIYTIVIGNSRTISITTCNTYNSLFFLYLIILLFFKEPIFSLCSKCLLFKLLEIHQNHPIQFFPSNTCT